MTGQEIVDLLREELDDVEEPHLWSTAFLLSCANQAEKEACIRALLITDKDTASDSGTRGICVLELSTGTAGYILSPLVLQVMRVKLPSDTAASSAGTAGYSYPLEQVTRDRLDQTVVDWENLTGVPDSFITEAGNEILFVPNPTITTTARLVVKRLPLADFTLSTSPEINDMYVREMLHWAKAMAYRKNDSDTMNLQLAEVYEKKFEAAFGPAVNFRDLRTRREIGRNLSMQSRSFGE